MVLIQLTESQNIDLKAGYLDLYYKVRDNWIDASRYPNHKLLTSRIQTWIDSEFPPKQLLVKLLSKIGVDEFHFFSLDNYNNGRLVFNYNSDRTDYDRLHDDISQVLLKVSTKYPICGDWFKGKFRSKKSEPRFTSITDKGLQIHFSDVNEEGLKLI